MIVCGQSHAFNSRKLVNANQDSPSSSPPEDKKPNPSPDEATKPKRDTTTSPSDVESKGLNDINTQKASENSGDKKLDKGKSQDGEEKVESKSCKGNPICNDQKKTMIACIQGFENGSNNVKLLVQNQQDVDLKGNITSGTSTNNYLQAFEIPGHGTKKVNINVTFSGDKSTKVVLNAGNGDCELQISQPKTAPTDTPSKSKDPKNALNPKDVDNPTDSPVKPKEENDPSKAKKADSPSKPTENEDASNPKSVDTPAKSKSTDVDDPNKSKDIGDPSNSNDADDPSKSKEVDDPLKSKEVDDPSKSKDVDDPSKSKDIEDPSKSKELNDPTQSKSKDVDPSKTKDVEPPPKPTTTNVDTPISQSNILDQLSFYSKQVTPIYGAYLAFLVALVIGGSWALCSFRKRRTDNGVQYQELEMGLPGSSNTVHVETAEGWDQDWDDDDWDEDKAIRSPGGRVQAKTISSNGLTSRSTKTDGWDADWDD